MTTLPRVRILSSGSEILQGLYPDTNAQGLSRLLFEEGFRVISHAAAPDDRDLLHAAVSAIANDCELAIMTGGLGPTEDDLTRDVVSEIYGSELRHDPRAERMMRDRFEARGIAMPERNIVQAMMPTPGHTLYNHWGTAPGFILAPTTSLPVFVALPGPPSEWRPMFERALKHHVATAFPDRPKRLVHTIHIAVVPESIINQALRDLFTCDDGNELTILAKRGHIRLRIIASGPDEATRLAQRDTMRAEILRRVGEALPFAEGAEVLTAGDAAVALMRARSETLSLAESCTGGLVAKMITDVPGASDVFLGGYVSYANAAKERDLAVPTDLLAVHGAVSEPVAIAMAEGARARTGSTWSVAITGVAGPGGGTPEKPVGTVCFAVAGPHGSVSRRIQMPGARDAIRDWSAHQALEFLRRFVLNLNMDALMDPRASTTS